jgi:signal transduction histidine kinase
MTNESASEFIPIRREPVDIAVLIELTIEVLRLQARALDVTLQLHVNDNVPEVVHVDPDKVAWVIANLVGSSMRHVRKGTQVMPGGAVHIDVDYNATRSILSIAVRDDGPGIAPDRLKGLLNPGMRSRPGGALALLLVQDIAAAHGGRIEIESSTDRFEHFTTVRFLMTAR